MEVAIGRIDAPEWWFGRLADDLSAVV